MRLLAPDIACQEVVELVTAYFDGSLSGRDRRRFRAHIKGCPHCSAYLEQMRLVIEASGELRVDDLAADVRSELVGAFRGWKRQRHA